MSKKSILVVSFGTSYPDALERDIEGVEKYLGRAFPEYELRRAFTSNIVMKILKNRDGIHVDSVSQAIQKLAEEGFEEVLIQPLHVINGIEYEKIKKQVHVFSHHHDAPKISIGAPLLSDVTDYFDVAKGIMRETEKIKDRLILLVGHGTHHHANAAYAMLSYVFHDMGAQHIFVGTVEGYPTYDAVIKQMQKREEKNVLLVPFMVVAGDHARNDIAGEEESWAGQLREEGYSVEAIMQGIGVYDSIRKVYERHIRDIQ